MQCNHENIECTYKQCVCIIIGLSFHVVIIEWVTLAIVCSHSQCPQNYDVMTLYVI